MHSLSAVNDVRYSLSVSDVFEAGVSLGACGKRPESQRGQAEVRQVALRWPTHNDDTNYYQ